MPQYLADIKENKFKIISEEAKHLVAAVRAKEGDEITIFDGKGAQYKAVIEIAEKQFVSGRITARISAKPARFDLTLCFAPVSKNALEEVLDKGTQLGVTCFIPVFTARTEHDILKRWENKKERWEQIIIAAVKQCGVPVIPVLREPAKFKEAFSKTDLNIMAYEGEEKIKLSEVLKDAPKDIRIFIGPAGGFTPDEVDFARAQNARFATLGNNIMRAETAAIAAAAIIMQ
ncbi:16S rRNA (uracil1498-N3)-methyltransferase [Elusimicrobium posterum]|uniref:RsmE family RNA methyltransferase n=1 Tax=Elusimicrobium posterum TaxID=3116653 RepID=UPI003C78A8B2